MDVQTIIAVIAAGLGVLGSIVWVLLGWAGIRSLRDIGTQLRGRQIGDSGATGSLPPSEQGGKERELLLAIRERGGRITAAEAVMETSLGMDETEQMLSDLANKGHLMVEYQGGALLYTLPGGQFIMTAQEA